MGPSGMGTDFSSQFELLSGNPPFPWQEALFDRFISGGELPRVCDIPTGLGKTSVIPIWFLALAAQPRRIPRRLVYVVNRRTVVDQTTNEVLKIRKAIEDHQTTSGRSLFKTPLAISTLRGQFADNRAWSADPSQPAVICGTVDMIGSRLLFSGYGIGYKQRPLHAGFLGQDVLLVHDEAHLEQPFQDLLATIREEQKRCSEFGRFHVMELTATPRGGHDIFGLTPQELAPPKRLPDSPSEPIHHVWRRLRASKGLAFHAIKRDAVAQEMARLALARKDARTAILLFARTVDDVLQLHSLLTNIKGGGVTEDRVGVLTGTMRGREREKLIDQPVFRSFLTSAAPAESVYLICTSAGEVGIDISAHHMVCDLSPLDSMAQRLGRVNRRGECVSEVDVVYETDPDPKRDARLEAARWKTLEVLERLPSIAGNGDRRDSSPLALRGLNLSPEERTAAFSPPPDILPTTDILFDAWSMTTIRGRLPGRPPVEPYLHGVAEWQPPETTVAWRWDVQWLTSDVLERNKVAPGDPEASENLSAGLGARSHARMAAAGDPDAIGDLFADYPLKPHETLKDRSDRVFKELVSIASRHPDAPAWLMDDEGGIQLLTMRSLADKDRKDRIEGQIVLLSPAVGGLTAQGTLRGREEFTTSISYDVADEWFVDPEKTIPRRSRFLSEDLAPEPIPKMRLIRELALRDDEEAPSMGSEEQTFDPQIHGRFWRWYVRPESADDDGSKTARIPVPLKAHVDQVVAAVTQIAGNLGLPDELQNALVRAAECHDLGKARTLWQRSIGNPDPDTPFAKSGRDPITKRLWKPQEISSYRHEFGSLVDVLHDPAVHLDDLPEEMRDLVLHLIAAHHGRGRPYFPKDEADDPEPKGHDCEAINVETALRFARLQKQYGRWGLAYLESILRAADYAASANPMTTEDSQ